MFFRARASPLSTAYPTPGRAYPLLTSPLLPSFLHIGYIGIPSTTNGFSKVAEHVRYILPTPLVSAHQCTVSGIWIPVQFSNIGDSAGPDRVQVNIASQVLKIGIFPADNGFVPILKRDVVQNTERVKTSKSRHALPYCTKRCSSQFTFLPAFLHVDPTEGGGELSSM